MLPLGSNGAAPKVRSGNVVHPRGATVIQPTRVLQPGPGAPAVNVPPQRFEQRPSPVVRTATPASAPARPAAPAAQRVPFRIPFWVKLVVIIAVGATAFAMLGAQRRSVVEIVSWMLIAGGTVPMVRSLAASPRRE